MSQLIENLLSELVATPSVNPMLMNASKADSEKDLSNYIYQYSHKKGIKVEFQEVFIHQFFYEFLSSLILSMNNLTLASST
jgi:hypothetical protein